ncbi:MAG: 16S rRNA (cytidine(1402)-2'-O)-methyltransferase [Monoglobales bacterium]
MTGTLYLCPTPIGNLEDITLRVIRILSEVDLIAAEDTRHTLKLLNHLDIKKPMISYFEHNKLQRGEEIIAKLESGLNIALVTDAGMPAISDPGEVLVFQCIERGIDVVPLPGPNAALTALIASGISASRFSFQGFLTMNKRSRTEHLEIAAKLPDTLIFYEAPHKLKSTLVDMLKFFGNRKIALCRELTKTYEEFIRTDIEGAIRLYEEKAPKGEYVLIIEGYTTDTAEEFEDIPLEELYKKYLDSGIDEKEALKKVAKDKGIPKRDAYSILKT